MCLWNRILRPQNDCTPRPQDGWPPGPADGSFIGPAFIRQAFYAVKLHDALLLHGDAFSSCEFER
jgi:hypothetical protein